MTKTNLIGAHICDGINASPPKISIVQIWNPNDSSLEFHLKTVSVAWNAGIGVQQANNYVGGWDFNFGTEALGSDSDVRYLQDKISSITTPSAIQLRLLQTTTPYPAARLIYEHWISPMGRNVPVEFDDPVVLSPGTGLQIRMAQPNVYNIVSVQGYTVSVS
jgi:hypothetical protein